ncbi:MAG: hypothetical protein HY329_19595 [Chloroflexi bacterium]|nr:hypothetical protein [Chloroflexota bacterium]
MIAFTGDPVRDRNQRVADQGTHSGAPLLAAAGVANLTELSTGEVQRQINGQGDELTARLNESFRQRGIKGCGYNVGSIVRFHVGDTAEELGLPYPTDSRLDKPHGELGKRITLAMLLEGVHVGGDAKSFLNAAMTDDDIREIARAYDRTLERLDAEGAI